MAKDKDYIGKELADPTITSPRTAEDPGPKPGKGEDTCCTTRPEGASKDEEERSSYIPTIVSLVLLLLGIALDFFDVEWFSGYLRLVVFGVAYVLVGGKVVKHAVTNIAKGNIFNEFFLMTIATVGAFYIGEYAEGVAVMLFYVIGEHFQEAAVARSRRSIKALIDNRPELVTVQRNGGFEEVSPKNVNIGEIIQVKPGEKIALDGEILSKGSSFNTAALTGESKPDTKRRGETVLAGMINLDKLIELLALRR